MKKVIFSKEDIFQYFLMKLVTILKDLWLSNHPVKIFWFFMVSNSLKLKNYEMAQQLAQF